MRPGPVSCTRNRPSPPNRALEMPLDRGDLETPHRSSNMPTWPGCTSSLLAGRQFVVDDLAAQLDPGGAGAADPRCMMKPLAPENAGAERLLESRSANSTPSSRAQEAADDAPCSRRPTRHLHTARSRPASWPRTQRRRRPLGGGELGQEQPAAGDRTRHPRPTGRARPTVLVVVRNCTLLGSSRGSAGLGAIASHGFEADLQDRHRAAGDAQLHWRPPTCVASRQCSVVPPGSTGSPPRDITNP